MEKEFKSNFLTRSATALLITLPILGIIYLQNVELLLLSVFLLLFATNNEWLRNSNKNKIIHNLFFLVLMILCYYLSLSSIKFLIIVIGISTFFWFLFSIFLLTEKTSKLNLISFNNTYIRLIILISFFCCSLILMKIENLFPFSNFILFFILILNSAISDSSAYLVGSSYGKTPLFSEISPNKSLEGFIGGMGSIFILSLVFCLFFNISLSFVVILLTGSFYAFVGDYFFSFLKRKSGVKDTGNILPGHGGILDRIDSHLSSFPVLIILLMHFSA